jgi:UDP-N-acetylmuramoyl-L-alanyl-D-glutamate--2,6-diaminopimelate ligase
MLLHQLFDAIPETRILGRPDLAITGLEYDSRRVRAGQLFFAIPGMKADGAMFIPEAVSRGAVAIVSEGSPESYPGNPPPTWVQASNARLAMALASDRFYEHPSRQVKLLGITGTNGKTTVAYLLASILKTAGWRPGLFGTIEYQLEYGENGEKSPAPNTTPESVDLQRMLRQVVDHGGRSAVMEVTSHALALERVAACHFHAAIFTNFSRDHLDFHPDLESYFEAKRRLFIPCGARPAPVFAVLNVDDPRSAALRSATPGRVITYGVESPADVTARHVKAARDGWEFTAETPAGPVEIRSPLLGRHNVYNLLAAVASALTLEISLDETSRGILPVRVPGRMEAIDEGQPFTVLVDYAHTDDALRHLLSSAQEWAGGGRLLLVFGCGGERDRSKRPLMGMAAAEADMAFLTSDNPRAEDPLGILNDVIVGMQKVKANYEVEPDRARAIELALREAKPQDTVIIAGKGHERYQTVGNQRLPFDDRSVARAVLRQLGFEKKKSEVRSQESEGK